MLDIKSNPACRDFIELSCLFKTLKSILLFKTTSIDSVFEQVEHNNNGHNGYYNSAIFEEIDDYINFTIKEKYQTPGKIDENVACYYRSVLLEYFKDMVFAHNNNTLPHYFNNTNRDFIADDDFIQHKTRIEYLVKNCKNKLAEIISKY